MLLPREPVPGGDVASRVREDHDHFARSGLPPDLEGYIRDRYRLDVASSYAGLPIKNPWGVASGQLSMRSGQVEAAATAGLGFVVLKTVIAQDTHGDRAMSAWAIKESRMVVEPIVGRATGERGWTVTWKGRGWWQSFDEYLALTRESVAMGREYGIVVVPSVKYHLPGVDEAVWRHEEYEVTTRALLEAFEAGNPEGPMPLEKDFSPTLAGSDRSRSRLLVLDWLRQVPGHIRATVSEGRVRVGLKLFNSLDDDDFQLAMLEQVHHVARPDYLIHANRLFDPERVFEGHKGVAYGGPDLSDRNLRILAAFRQRRAAAPDADPALDISATGNIHSGRLAMEYALRGCGSFQMHTLFQLPFEEFAMKRGDRLERALHRLYFDPVEGLLVWLSHVGERLSLRADGLIRLGDVARLGATRDLGQTTL